MTKLIIVNSLPTNKSFGLKLEIQWFIENNYQIEFWDLTEGDTQIMKLGYGTFWFAKHNNALCNYIGEREFDKILFGKRGENSEQN